jgi:flagellar L-ring protein precursor FlgH
MAAKKWQSGLRMAATAALAAAALAACGSARAQSSSLFGDPQARQGQGLMMNDASWTYEVTADPRQFKINDQVTVIVSEKSSVESQGKMNQQKQITGKGILSNWILLNKMSVVPDPQTAGSPTVGGEYDNQFQTQADLQTADTMTFKIACRIVDRRPNGLLVIEGRRKIQNNDNIWEQGVSGVIRPQDVLPNNTVLSENVGELFITKREEGHVRDGYRRGWLGALLDKYQAF